jgi:hypothetical protein
MATTFHNTLKKNYLVSILNHLKVFIDYIEKMLEKDKDYLNNDRIKELYEKIPNFMHKAFH